MHRFQFLITWIFAPFTDTNEAKWACVLVAMRVMEKSRKDANLIEAGSREVLVLVPDRVNSDF